MFFARSIIRRTNWILLPILLLLAGCGGGGGTNSSSGDQIILPGGATRSPVALSITKSALQLGESTTVTATVKTAEGAPAIDIPVTFTTTTGTLSPANGVVKTNANGVASIQLTAGTSSGQGQINATATVDNKLVTQITLYSVNLPPLKLANIVLTGNPAGGAIDFGSSQGISVEVQDANGKPYTESVDVLFTSTQAALGKATVNSPIATVNGKATTTYTALTATGQDTVTASIAGSSVTIPIMVNPLSAGAITFVSAVPSSIGLKGMGGVGIPESSKVTFKVVDTSGAPKANQPVTFALNTAVGGLTLSTLSGSTANDGTVSTTVHSGVVATPVRVTASTKVGAATLSTQSDQLVISTGVPSQDAFSTAVSNMNPEAYNVDGVIVTVSARLADHFHNPVPDGTAVYFTTSGGSIEPSCTTVNGGCSVNWRSQNPRPVGIGKQNNGRAVILAYAVGEEAFLDLNGNGLADATDSFTDTGEAFRDDNEDGKRESTETFIDFNGNGAFDAGDGNYNGVLQGTDFAGAPKSKHVFANSTIVLSTSGALITAIDGSTGLDLATSKPISKPGLFSVKITDENGNTMPSGTKVAITSSVGVLSGTAAYVFPQNIGTYVSLPVYIDAGSSPTAKSGLVTVTVTSPGGLVTSLFIPVSGTF